MPGRYTRLGYRSATIARREGTYPLGASEYRHQEYDRPLVINQSRMFYADNPIYKGMIDQAASYIVGDGYGLMVMSDDPVWNTAAEALWRDYWTATEDAEVSGSPEITGTFAGPELEELVCRERLLTGDTGVLLTVETDERGEQLLQHVEAEQITGKSGVPGDGITRNRYGRALNAWVAQYTAAGYIDSTKGRLCRLGSELLLVGARTRSSAVRSMPPAQSAFPNLHRINDVCDSEALAWQAQCRIALKTQTANPAALANLHAKADTAAQDDAAPKVKVTELPYAMFFHAKPGQTIEAMDRKIPGLNFGESLKTYLRLLGLPLGMPIELVFIHWDEANYSRARAVFQQMDRLFRKSQESLATQFLRPVVLWKLREWMDRGRLPARELRRSEVQFRVPPPPWLDELKEVQAQGAKIDRGFCSYGDVVKSLNMDPDQVMTDQANWIRKAVTAAKALADEMGEPELWTCLWPRLCGYEAQARNGRPPGTPSNPAARALPGSAAADSPDPDDEPDPSDPEEVEQ